MQETTVLEGADKVRASTDSIPYHSKSVEECLELLDSRLLGLNDSEIEERRKKYGKNQIRGSHSDIARRLFLHQFKNLVVILLFVAASLSFYMEDVISGVAILIAMLINAFISFITKWKAQKAMMSLEAFSEPLCTVMRDGLSLRVPSAELVPGDILVLSAGQTVPGDARLISTDDLQVDESPLTGESVLIMKDALAIHIPDENITEQKNMIFAGTTIKTGSGKAIITNIGRYSQMGKIAVLAGSAYRRESHLTKELNRVGLTIFSIVSLLALLVAFLGYHQGASPLEMAQIAIVLVVAAVPEILPAVATFILTLGIERLAKENTIVRNLHAIEAIGSVTVICTDKTGTLTENSLSVHRVYVPDLGPIDYDILWSQAKGVPCRSVEELLRVGRLNNTTILDGVRSFMMGDPIDVALYRATPAEYEFKYHRVRDYPFDSSTMLMSSVYKTVDGKLASMIKGAPEAIMDICNYYLAPDGRVIPLSKEKRFDFLLGNQDLALDGILRIIGFAEKPLSTVDEEPYQNAVFIGWVCLIDPPKPGVKKAIQECQKAGVRVVMITGDQKPTAAIMARELGILPEGTEVWTRKDLDSGVDKIPQSVRVFARTQPEEKLAIVQSLEASGDIVAMVGDGVNDAPAMRKSDVAIAMGIRGAEAAKESSDIILLNDRFETIALAVLIGRIQANNVRLSIEYLLSCNIGLVVLMVAAAISGFGLPLNALQILWINIITVTIPALSLAFEPGNQAIHKHPTRSYNQGILPLEHFTLVGFWSLLLTAAGLGSYLTSLLIFKHSPAVASTLSFTTLAIAQTFHLLNIQMVHSGGSKKTFLSEISRVPLTWVIVLLAFILQIGAVYILPFQVVLKTKALSPIEWGIPILFALFMMLVSVFMIKTERGGDEEVKPKTKRH